MTSTLSCWSSCLLVFLFSCPLISSASIFNGKLADSVNIAGDALLIFAFSTSKGLPAGDKSAGFSRESPKLRTALKSTLFPSE